MLVDLGSLAAPALDAALRGCRHPLGRLVAEDVVVATSGRHEGGILIQLPAEIFVSENI